MKSANDLLANVAPTKQDSPQKPPSGATDQQLELVITTLSRMGLLEKSADVFKTWKAGLSDLQYSALRSGLSKAKDCTDYLTMPRFREMCRQTAEELGLPEVHAAYIEAAMSDGVRERVRWSHPVVYATGRETGWFELRRSTEKEIYPLFKKNYAEMCRRFLAGERMEIPIQKALPDRVFQPADENHARSRLDEMKNMLNG